MKLAVKVFEGAAGGGRGLALRGPLAAGPGPLHWPSTPYGRAHLVAGVFDTRETAARSGSVRSLPVCLMFARGLMKLCRCCSERKTRVQPRRFPDSDDDPPAETPSVFPDPPPPHRCEAARAGQHSHTHSIVKRRGGEGWEGGGTLNVLYIPIQKK